jgi:hypothetical protein
MKKLLTVAAALGAVAVAAPLAGAGGYERNALPKQASWDGVVQVERNARPKAAAWDGIPKVERGSLPKMASWDGRTPNPYFNFAKRPNPTWFDGRRPNPFLTRSRAAA